MTLANTLALAPTSVKSIFLDMKVDHKLLLELALLEYSNQEPDIMLICKDHEQISTSKFLLLLHSEMIRDILASVESNKTVSLSIPFSSGSVMNLLNILATGEAVSDNTETLIEVNIVAKVLGIKFVKWELGSESLANKQKAQKKVLKEKFWHDEIKDDRKEPVVKTEQCYDDEDVNDNDMTTEPADDCVNIKPSKGKQESDYSIQDFTDTTSKTDYAESKRQKNTSEKRRYLDSLVCNICGRSFSAPGSLKKHLEQKVCERKIANKNKIEEMMRKAMQMVKA